MSLIDEADVCSSPIPERIENSVSVSLVNKKESYPRPPDYDSWMPCKKQAWDQMEENPNGFFYRHVLPGEVKKNGPWSAEEKKLFIETLRKEPLGNTHWGLFARNIPGRVGYQCNAFFKKLIATGELQELAPDVPIPPQKVNDESGKSKETSKSRKKSVIVNGEVIVSDKVQQYNLEYSCDPEIVLIGLQEKKSFSSRIIEKMGNPKSRASFISSAKLFF